MKNFLFLLFLFIFPLCLCQTQFYFQDFENSSNPSGIDWTFSHTSVSRDNNYWVWGSGTAGNTIGAATYQGTGSLQVWRRARVQGSDVWLTNYGNHANQNRTAQKTFDFSTIPLGSSVDLSFWLLCRGELGTNGIYYDYLEVEINGTSVLGPIANVIDWTFQTIDLSNYVGYNSVTITFRWRNDNSVANQPAARIDNIKIEYIEPNPLPVTLTSFTANCNGDNVDINWTTATEYNASHYSLQNSRNGQNWVEVAKIQSAGTTNQTTNYSYQDKSFGGISYYRLVQVDFDGQFEIFGPISVNCEIDINNIIIYPNPSSNTISIQMINQLDETMDLTILDFNGKIIFEKTISTQIIEQIDLKDYMNGVYIFIFSSLNQTYTTKIIKI
jgi:hypothetical protein